MNKYHSKIFSILYRIRFIGLLIILLAGSFFLTKPAEMQSSSVSSPQNLVNGRLAFTSRVSGPTFPDGRIFTSNPDGSGQNSLPIPLLPPPVEPVWSPDGTQIVYANQQAPYDIFKINANGTGGRVNLTNTESNDTAQYDPS